MYSVTLYREFILRLLLRRRDLLRRVRNVFRERAKADVSGFSLCVTPRKSPNSAKDKRFQSEISFVRLKHSAEISVSHEHEFIPWIHGERIIISSALHRDSLSYHLCTHTSITIALPETAQNRKKKRIRITSSALTTTAKMDGSSTTVAQET